MEVSEVNLISLITETINTIFSNFFSSVDNSLYGVLDDITFVTKDIMQGTYMDKFLRNFT